MLIGMALLMGSIVAVKGVRVSTAHCTGGKWNRMGGRKVHKAGKCLGEGRWGVIRLFGWTENEAVTAKLLRPPS